MKIKNLLEALMPNFILLLILTGNLQLFAQDPASIELQMNRVKITVNANGALFTDFEEGQFLVPNGNEQTSLLKASGLWIGGFDPGGNLKLAAQLDNENGQADFQPGILDPISGESTDLVTGIYRVTAEEIEAHLADFADNGIIDDPQPGVFGWPARGNQFFAQYNDGQTLPNTPQGLAGFFDLNGDISYDPDQGDYPILEIRGCDQPTYADEMLWFAYNDVLPHSQSGGDPLNVEIQSLIFAYNCQESPLGHSVFVRNKIIYRGNEPLDSCFIGQFNDFSIGNANENLFGSDSQRFLVYGYSGNVDDIPFSPVVAMDLMRGPLDNAVTPPSEVGLTYVLPVEDSNLDNSSNYYNILSGRFPDGGLPPFNSFFYDGNPNDPNVISEISEGNSPGVRKVLTSNGPFRLEPGAVNEFIMAYTFYQEPGNDNLQNIEVLYEETDQVQALFDNCFDVESTFTSCTPDSTISSIEQVFQPTSIKIYPNPATMEAVLEVPDLNLSTFTIYDALGRLVSTHQIPPHQETITLNIEHLAKGIYVIQGINKTGKIYQTRLIKAGE